MRQLQKTAGFLLGVLLLPLCAALTRAVLDLLRELPPAHAAIPPAGLALAGGVGCWLALYFTLPRPMRTYVLAHELTHALWGLCMGARVIDLRVSRDRGSVTLSKSNVLITLAPYFFPFYAVLVLLVYSLLGIFFPVERYYLFWLWVIGLAWGFHLTFTISTLLQRQSDIHAYGHMLSYALIYALNMTGVGIGIVMITDASLEQLVACAGDRTGAFYRAAAVAVSTALARLAHKLNAASG